jgi:NAD(P)-dependent dehydrogenase (short-subunit alcohol dehydrogenase family)
MAELTGKVIMVTGGASGLGHGVVTAAAAEGALVAILDFDLANAQRVADQTPDAKAYSVDVSDAGAVEAVCAQVVADFGRLDGAVNCAGISGDLLTTTEASIDNWKRVLDVNLSGIYYSVRAQLPHLLNAGGGSIVNFASMAGIRGEARLGAYTASKHGVVGLTKVVALEYGRQQIRCNAVCPSFVKTPMVLKDTPEDQWKIFDEMHPIGRTVTVQEVANATIFLLSDKSSGITGSCHMLDGGASAR